MKKRLLTYLFIVCGIFLHLNVFAKPPKKSHLSDNTSGYTKSVRTFTFKKALASLYTYPVEKNAGIFFHQHSIRILGAVVSYYRIKFLSISFLPCSRRGDEQRRSGKSVKGPFVTPVSLSLFLVKIY